MTRDEIYNAIDSERDFQLFHAALEDMHIVPDISLGDTISAMEYNLDKLRNTWYHERQPYPESMHYVRKIAALAVQIGERFGVPNRE